MDRRTDWPWDWEEEVEWKAELEKPENDFLGELIDNALEDGMTGSRYVVRPQQDSLSSPAQVTYN
jgi:hypothetical protein